ncbi:hypothetical protein ACIBQ1_38315 [Nonomuraea sp. NPDC050153]|uniref:hypothetical protein n=1 Tax=Nonomuraea sp. NPDC050153 TaxID=3364359 RepID=UPI003796E129
MRRTKHGFVNAVLVFLVAAPLTASLAAPAQADEGHWSRERSGCVYTGGISADHRYAWTAKSSGGCDGHPWLRIYSNYSNITEYWEGHKANLISRSGTLCPDPSFCAVYHRSQSNESYGQSH